MSRPGEPVKLVRLMNSHLRFRAERWSIRCMICRKVLDPGGDPSCERCGLLTFCCGCYVKAIARTPNEEAFWTSTDAEEQEALTPFAPFLCPGCRS